MPPKKDHTNKAPKIELTDAIDDVYYANVYNATVTPHGDIRIDFGQDRPVQAHGGGVKKVERVFERGLYISIPTAKQLGMGLLKIIENTEKGQKMANDLISKTEGHA